jgi:hypothetical protein
MDTKQEIRERIPVAKTLFA